MVKGLVPNNFQLLYMLTPESLFKAVFEYKILYYFGFPS